MAKALILGDPHLGKGLSIGRAGIGSALNSRIVDQIRLLDWVLDKCEDMEIETLIITGDVFEEPKPHPTLIKIFLGWLKKCEAHGVMVHIIQGNHDIMRSGQFTSSALDIFAEAELDNVFVYNRVHTIHLDGISVTFLPFTDRRSFNVGTHDEAISNIRNKLVFEAASIPPGNTKVLVGHLTIAGSIYVGDEIDDASNELFCPKEMFSMYEYVWMGHIHRPQVIAEGATRLAHIGSMDISDFGETDHTKVLVTIDTDGYSSNWQTIPIPTRPLYDLSIAIPVEVVDTTQFVLDTVAEGVPIPRGSIVRVTIQLAGPDLRSVDRKIIEGALYVNGVFHICAFSETRKLELIRKKADNIHQSMTESAAIRGWSDKFVEEKLRDDFCALAEDIRKELQNEEK